MEEPNKEIRIAVYDAFEACLEGQLRAIRKLKMKTLNTMPVKKLYQHDFVYEILHSKKRPMHINEIIKLIYKKHNKPLDRDSLVSALTKKAKLGDRFTKVAANTFGLREFEMTEEEYANYLNARENNLNININRRRQEYE